MDAHAPPMAVPQSFHGSNTNEVAHLRSQNDQLWKIIEKQRIMIQSLQKDNARLATERDGLAERLSDLEREMGHKTKQRAASILISPELLREIAEADGTLPPSSDTIHAPADSASLSPSPVPPPRSPFRSAKEGNASSVSINNSSTPTLVIPDATPPIHKEQQLPHQNANPAVPSLENDPSPPESPSPQTHPAEKESEVPAMREHTPPPPMAPQRRRLPDALRQEIHSLRDGTHSPPTHGHAPQPSLIVPPSRNKRNSTIVGGQFIQDDAAIVLSSTPPKQPPPPPPAMNPPALHEPEVTSRSNPLSDLGLVVVKVVSSSIKINDKGKEVVSFTLSVCRKRMTTDRHEELWRVEKFHSDFLGLDSKLKLQQHPDLNSQANRLPNKALFTTHAPSKVDVRKVALEQYLRNIMAISWQDTSDICEFLSSNIVKSKPKASGRKEGYLTKRGKNFGGWKSRYFILNGTSLEYYDTKDGNQLGSIRLVNAQIGRQSSSPLPTADDSNNAYRHAFLIVEQRKPGSAHVVRHILFADSDTERDAWVDAIFQNIRFDDEPPPELRKEDKAKPKKTPSKDRAYGSSKADPPVPPLPTFAEPHAIGVAVSSDPPSSVSTGSTESLPLPTSVTLAASATPDQLPPQGRSVHTPPPVLARRSSTSNLAAMANDPPHSDPRPAQTLSPTPMHNGDTPSDVTDLPGANGAHEQRKARNKANRMTFWGKKMLFSSSPDLTSSTSSTTSSSSSLTPHAASPKPSTSVSATTDHRASMAPAATIRNFLTRTSNESTERSGGSRKHSEDNIPSAPARPVVFGVPLEEAVRISRIQPNYQLPAVVYRCIEYLDAKNAVLEEGLYRLSGSSTVMKALKQSFDQEYDVNLLASKQDYDVHAIAGLLKMWLRELPTSVLTRELRMDFLHVIDLLDRKDRVNELGRLVSQLPLANYTLLRALTAHLIRVVQHAHINKMTMRNVCIVFSPTLGIPAMIFNLFMSEFEYIFWTTEDGDAAPRMIEEPSVVVTESSDAVQGEPSSAEAVSSTQPQPSTTEGTDDKPQLGRRPTLKLREEFGRSNRNSVNYIDGAPNAIVDMEKNIDGATAVLDEEDEEEVDSEDETESRHDQLDDLQFTPFSASAPPPDEITRQPSSEPPTHL